MKALVAATLFLTAVNIGSAGADEPCLTPNGAVVHQVQNTTAAPKAQAPGASAKSLYDRLGGEAAITAVVEDFVARAAANPKVNITRKGTKKEWDPSPENVAKLKKHLVQLVCMATGGPQKYEGKGMKEAHAGMEISDQEFAAIAVDLVATLNKFKVPAAEQQELLKIISGTSKDIIEKHTKPMKSL